MMAAQTKITLAALMVAHATASSGEDKTASPVTKVLDLLSSLEAKIIKEGEAAQKEFTEYSEWCEDRSANVAFEIKTGKSQIADLKATIEKEVATASSLETKIEELSASIATDEADLKAATEIRAKENSDFKAEEKELVEVVDMLGRAIGILEREMRKGGAALVQWQKVGTVTQALSALVQASVFSSADANRLTALVQSSQQSEDEDDDAGAPAAAVYEGHSDGIIETLEDLEEKASKQLADARQKEQTALHNFEMLKQSLTDSVKFGQKDMSEAKKSLAQSGETKAAAESDLSVTTKDLNEDVETQGSLKQNCMEKSQDFEAETKSRGEELKALAAAKKVISETTSGAADIAYSFLQTSSSSATGSARLASGTDLANFEAVRYVRDLARKQNDPALAQLASRMAAAMRMSNNNGSQDPFAKVKGLIRDMLERLEADSKADASHKAYCDKELKESKQGKLEKEYDIEKLTTKIDQMTARSAQLKEEVAALQRGLAELASSQAEMDKLRAEEKATFQFNSAETKQGLEGVKMALKVLREYYAQDGKDHSAAEGSATSIVGLLEVVESDFSRGLAEMTATEENAQTTYDRESYSNKIEKTMKEKDVDYKTKESVDLDKRVTEANSDRSSVQTELDAVNEYLSKLEDTCIAKPETYEERARRREAEIAGLKEALQILEGEAVLLQNTRRALRGVQRH